MEPEELKIIAEGMGYEKATLFTNDYGTFVLLDVEGNKIIQYNPFTNDTQCMEIMEKLRLHVSYTNNRWFVIAANSKRSFTGHGKTINEAVCKAALEYFKGEGKL